jgi:hypothetical protein
MEASKYHEKIQITNGLTASAPPAARNASRMLDPAGCRPAHIAAPAPLLIVIVDTEEEFDWSRPLSRDNVAVRAMRAQTTAHRIFERYGITPTYVLDYPVASQEDGFRPLREIHRDGRCCIGAHLHPWVNPPHEEAVTNFNSYPGNLPPALEREKLARLTAAIEASFGLRPSIYKAGRHGVGQATPGILEALGYEIDASVVAWSDFTEDEGPNFRRCGVKPYWFGSGRQLLELPVTAGFAGALAGLGRTLYGPASTRVGRLAHLPGLLARAGLLERLRLSPEGMTFEEMRRLTDHMIAIGHSVFSFTYHSPSLAPGNTPYTPDEPALAGFLDRFERYFAYFMGELGGRAATPSEVLALARAGEARSEAASHRS